MSGAGSAASVRRFELDARVAAAPERVQAFLADIHNLRDLHPLIVEIRDLEPRPDHPRARHYEIVDRIPVGPITLRTTYRAVMQEDGPGRLSAVAWQSPGVRLDTRYELQAGDGGESTQLVERVEVRAPLGLRGFVVRQASAAHATTLERLSRLLGPEEAAEQAE